MGSIKADYIAHEVVWRMSPDEAKEVARFISDEAPLDDLAQGDAWALKQAAEKLGQVRAVGEEIARHLPDPMSDDLAPESS